MKTKTVAKPTSKKAPKRVGPPQPQISSCSICLGMKTETPSQPQPCGVYPKKGWPMRRGKKVGFPLSKDPLSAKIRTAATGKARGLIRTPDL